MANFKPKYNSINHETISPHLQASTHLNTPPILTSKVLILFQNMRKSITIAIVHKCFLPKLQLAIKGRELLLFIHKWVRYQGGGRMASSRRAHQVLEMGLPSVGEWAATSPHIHTCVKQKSTREEGAPPLESVGCHLKGAPPLQEGRTSLITCANIFKDMNSIKCQSTRSCPL
jgi:hypothetical protein